VTLMQALPGFRDFLPDACAARNYIFARWREVARRYGFVEWEGPILEPTELYKKKSGAEIVNQLFNFTDKGEREVAMRPELTPTLARVVAAHEREFKKPLKWFSIGQFFRYEKQQRGRLREFYQLNADIVGEQVSPSGGDGELIAFSVDLLRALGFTQSDFVVRLGSRDVWVLNFLKNLSDPPMIPHLQTQSEFFQILDKLEREPDDLINDRLKRLNTSLANVRDFIQATKEKLSNRSVDASNPSLNRLDNLYHDLEARGLAQFIDIDLTTVRGLAYYNGTVFELYNRKGNERAIAGGGRYDGLLPNLFGVNLTAVGFAMGDVVLANFINDTPHAKEQMQSWISSQRGLDIYVVVAKEARRAAALGQIQQLRDRGYRVDYPLTPMKVARQFQAAEDAGASLALLYGDEWPKLKIKDLATREERLIAHEELLAHLQAQSSVSS
jgi:histidyl-tRNA synthetase